MESGENMKTVRIDDNSHENLVRIAGRLQAASGESRTLDDAIAALTSHAFSNHEIGLEFKDIFYATAPSKESAFLWSWGLASLAKHFQDCYGFDSIVKYAMAFMAEKFSRILENCGSDVSDEKLLDYFEKQKETPSIVKEFLRKCADDGIGNYVRNGKIEIEFMEYYLLFILCFEDGTWNQMYIENIEKFIEQRKRNRSYKT